MHYKLFLGLLMLTLTALPFNLTHPSLHKNFHRFQILTPRHIRLRTKRWAEPGKNHTLYTILTFSVFGRKVSLSLKQGMLENLLAPNARLEYLHGDGLSSDILLDSNDFHSGIIQGHDQSYVHAIKHEEDTWMIHATHPDHQHLTFSVEPLSLYTSSLPSSNKASRRRHRDKMVAYRYNDIKFYNQSGETFCQTFTHEQLRTKSNRPKHTHKYSTTKFPNHVHHGDSKFTHSDKVPPGDFTASEQTEHENARVKRDMFSHDICDMLAIADYLFYVGVGEGSVVKSSKLLLSIYETVRHIFTHTDFSPWGYDKSVGVQIRGMKVFTNPEMGKKLSRHLYTNRGPINGRQVINDMTTMPGYKDYCLVHLSTQKTFRANVMGMAMTGRSGLDAVFDFKDAAHTTHYGICSTQIYNIGVSTVTYQGYTTAFRLYELVVTHEVGHNFGSSHDVLGTSELDKDCAPSEEYGGKYMMWEHSNTGLSKNNNKFSTCSRKAMAEIIKTRNRCFLSKEKFKYNQCGNGRVDFGEDCDAGSPDQLDDSSGCCTPFCRFAPGAVCSNFNHPCCLNCSVAPYGTECSGTGKVQCSKPGICDGKNHYSCTLSGAESDGTQCGVKGECQGGKCIHYCRLEGRRRNPPEELRPCNCDANAKVMCTVCCQTSGFGRVPDGTCTPSGVIYPNGTPCEIGHCERGVCTGLIQDIKWYEEKEKGGMNSNQPSAWKVTVAVIGLTCIIMVCLIVVFILFKK